jgi:hypothetical protein
MAREYHAQPPFKWRAAGSIVRAQQLGRRSVYRHLLLAVALGTCTTLPAPASAHGHGPGHPNVGSVVDFRIIVHDGPKFGHHRHPPRGYLRSQPWPPRFNHYAPAPRWQHRPHYQARHFWSRDNDGRHHFKGPHQKGWAHAPVRDHGRHAGFKHRNHRR